MVISQPRIGLWETKIHKYVTSTHLWYVNYFKNVIYRAKNTVKRFQIFFFTNKD